MRRFIKQQAKGQRFLNLFCYTATATVQAALGGARASKSVDLSLTYCDWAKRNFALNGLSPSLHEVIRADCIQWLQTESSVFDLILLDPPTFSNSKKTTTVLDIQRDHVALIQLAMQHLSPEGLLIFSNNYRGFKLDSAALAAYHIEDFKAASFDPDFKRDTKLHHCWLFRRAKNTDE